jgi:NADH-quinone oxidoreductase subunit C
MESTALVALLQQAVPDATIDLAPSADALPTVIVSRDHVLAVCSALKDHPDVRFEVLADLAAVDRWPQAPRYDVHYLLVSLTHHSRLRVKVRLDGDDAHVVTVSHVWPSANWLEREVWDLFGIAFDEHPDPRRLLMPEDWEGHPLRKDYPVQIRMTPKTTEATQVTEAEFKANLLRDRLSRH